MIVENNLELLKALSEESIYRIIEVLLRDERCVYNTPHFIGRIQSNTSMHLTKLSDLGVLKSRRDSRKIVYSIKDLRVCDAFNTLGYSEGKFLGSCSHTKKQEMS